MAKKVNLNVKKDEKIEKILNEEKKTKNKTKQNKLTKKEFKEKYRSCIVKETVTG